MQAAATDTLLQKSSLSYHTSTFILGSIAAVGIYNLRSPMRGVMNFTNSIPIMNPDIITGVSLFLLFVSFGVSQGFTTVVLAHIAFCAPYVVLSVMPRLKKMNPNIYEAALDLGATPLPGCCRRSAPMQVAATTKRLPPP